MVRIGGPALPYDPTYHLLARVDKIRALVKREHPDVLEAHSPYVAMLAVRAASRESYGVRTMWWHADHVDTYLRPPLAKRFGERAADRALRPVWRGVGAALRGFDAVFAAGRWQVEKLRAAGLANVVHAPFGVEKSVFRPEAKDARVRAEMLAGAPEGTRLLVGIGRFAIEKRWDVVIDAFARARDRDGVRARLVLFGDGPERARMEARIAGRDYVKLQGFEKDRGKLAAALASADLLVHGCPYETYGLGVAEAMAAGLPVVVPDQGGATEGIVPASSATYASLDADACARAIVEMLARDPAELRAAALAAAAGVRDVADHYRALLDDYRRLLDGVASLRSA